MEATYQRFFEKPKDRELMTAKDGGTMGVDWYIDKDGEGRPSRLSGSRAKPLLLLVPGLGGGSNNLYTHSLA